MTDWKYYKEEHPEFFNTERTILELVNSLPSFEAKWTVYLNEEYKDKEERVNYVDISLIGRHIILLFKEQKLNELETFFETVEIIYNNCDSETKELLTTGLLESIQNSSYDEKIDYHFEFNALLLSTTRKEWDNLIEFWEKDRNIKTT